MPSRYQQTKSIKRPEIPLGWRQQTKVDGGRDRVITLLNAVSGKPRYDGNESVWDPVLELLNLPLSCQPAISGIIEENRWRQSQNPKAYVATAASRQALAMHLADFTDREFKRINSDDFSDDGERGADLSEDEDGGDRVTDEDRLEYQDFCQAGRQGGNILDGFEIPMWLRHEIEYDRIDWSIVAKHAALTPRMVPALTLTLSLRFHEQLSRDAAMRKVAKSGQQHEVEAAWKWIDRNWKARIVSLFRMESAPAIVPKANPVPQRSTSPTPPWEAMQQACARQESKPDWIHAPSLMQKGNTLRRYNSLQLDSLLRRRDRRRFIDHLESAAYRTNVPKRTL